MGESLLVRALEEYRVPLLAICLPISYLYGCFISARRQLARWLAVGPSTHEERVLAVVAALKRRAAEPAEQRRPIVTDRPITEQLCTGFFNKADKWRVPTSTLRHILRFDEERRTLLVEPMVTVEEAANFLVPRGFILASHLEFGRATLGGLAMAVGMTTHAHVTGLFQETVVAYEVALATGELLRATADGPHADLFRALPWSHGTLCTVVALELKVIPARRYVRLKYIPVQGQANIMEEIRSRSGAKGGDADVANFCEATLFSKDRAVITVGDFDYGSEPGDAAKVNPLASWYKPWWFKHVESICERGQVVEELVPLWDYILRHTRSIFWVIELMVPYGNHPLFRYLFGWLLPLDVTFMKLTTNSEVRKLTFQKQVFQDITLPMTDMEEAVDLAADCFDVWPLLIYPCKEFDHGEGSGQLRPPRPSQLCPGAQGPKWGMFFDLGIYGAPGYVLRKEPYNPTKAFQRFMRYVKRVGGHPFLYADHFFNEAEFEELFDLTLWRQCRVKYKADGNYPGLWDKVRPEIDIISAGDVNLFEESQKKKKA